MEKQKPSVNRLSEVPPIRWLLPPHVEFEVAASISECLEWLSSGMNEKDSTTFTYKRVSDGEASFEVSRTRNRTFVTCKGTLRQVDVDKTLLHANMINTNILALLAAVFGSLPFIFFGTHPACAIVCVLPFWWGACSFSAWMIYQQQQDLAYEFEVLFRWHVPPHETPLT